MWVRATTGATRNSFCSTLALSNRRGPMRVAIAVILFSVLLAAQTVWREYPAFEYNDFPIPPDYQEKTEWAFARLMYPNAAFGSRGFGRFRGFGGDWRLGGRGIFW